MGIQPITRKSPTEIRADLAQIEVQTGVKSAIVYIRFKSSSNISTEDTDILDLGIITANGENLPKRISNATKSKVIKVAKEFYEQVSSPSQIGNDTYLKSAQQLYKWLISPLEEELKKEGITNLSLSFGDVGVGLRSIPFAALHDGKQFLIEKYSIGTLPSISLTDSSYKNIRDNQILAMGASEFAKDQNQPSLKAVPLELSTISQKLWRGKSILNQDFTLENLKEQRRQNPFGIIHLATHVDFTSGDSSKSYIQLYNSKLSLNEVRNLGWNKPSVDLLVLSACKSAYGDEKSELGFAGLALQTGVKSSVASLWYISDAGTLGLMTEFYSQLKTSPIKAEALRQAQIAMIQGKVRIEGNKLIGVNNTVELSPELAKYLQENSPGKFSDPFYWAPFTMIGRPW